MRASTGSQAYPATASSVPAVQLHSSTEPPPPSLLLAFSGSIRSSPRFVSPPPRPGALSKASLSQPSDANAAPSQHDASTAAEPCFGAESLLRHQPPLAATSTFLLSTARRREVLQNSGVSTIENILSLAPTPPSASVSCARRREPVCLQRVRAAPTTRARHSPSLRYHLLTYRQQGKRTPSQSRGGEGMIDCCPLRTHFHIAMCAQS